MRESSTHPLYKRSGVAVALVAAALLSLGLGLIGLGLSRDAAQGALPSPLEQRLVLPPPPVSPPVRAKPLLPLSYGRAFATLRVRSRAAVRRHRAERRAARHQPHSKPRATISLYERTVKQSTLRRQGCRAAKRGVGGIVILDFGQPAYNGHTYGTNLFSGRFAGNKVITHALLAYAVGYRRCLRPASRLRITLARGTSNYHPQVPSAYKAGRKWARETMKLQHILRARGLHEHVTSAAADDVEPAWDRTFRRTRDFFRGYRDARTGHLLYNYGSLDGGVGAIWSARQAFYVTSGMRYARAIPEIYNHTMAKQWADLAHIARRRYHRPVRFAGVMTTHTSRNRGMKPRDAHKILVRELAHRIGASAAAAVPTSLTNIRSAE